MKDMTIKKIEVTEKNLEVNGELSCKKIVSLMREISAAFLIAIRNGQNGSQMIFKK